MPPAVGNAETSSDMQSPMIRMKAEIAGQPSEVAIGPPLFQAWPNVVKQPDRIEMIENEIAKFEKPLQRRSNSCVYPSSASRFASASSTMCGWLIQVLRGLRVVVWRGTILRWRRRGDTHPLSRGVGTLCGRPGGLQEVVGREAGDEPAALLVAHQQVQRGI